MADILKIDLDSIGQKSLRLFAIQSLSQNWHKYYYYSNILILLDLRETNNVSDMLQGNWDALALKSEYVSKKMKLGEVSSAIEHK